METVIGTFSYAAKMLTPAGRVRTDPMTFICQIVFTDSRVFLYCAAPVQPPVLVLGALTREQMSGYMGFDKWTTVKGSMKASVDYSNVLLNDDTLKTMKKSILDSFDYDKVNAVSIGDDPSGKQDDLFVYIKKGMNPFGLAEIHIRKDSLQELVELINKTPLAQKLKVDVHALG